MGEVDKLEREEVDNLEEEVDNVERNMEEEEVDNLEVEVELEEVDLEEVDNVEMELVEVDNVEMELVVRHGLLPNQQSLGEEASAAAPDSASALIMLLPFLLNIDDKGEVVDNSFYKIPQYLICLNVFRVPNGVAHGTQVNAFHVSLHHFLPVLRREALRREALRREALRREALRREAL